MSAEPQVKPDGTVVFADGTVVYPGGTTWPLDDDEPNDPLGNDKGPAYASLRRVVAVLVEAVAAGALPAEDFRSVSIVAREETL